MSAGSEGSPGIQMMHANLVTTTFRSVADLEAASRELRNVAAEIAKAPGLRAYLLIQTGERQVTSLGVYHSELAATQALEALAPLFGPIVTPRVDMPPDFGGGTVLAWIFHPS